MGGSGGGGGEPEGRDFQVVKYLKTEPVESFEADLSAGEVVRSQ